MEMDWAQDYCLACDRQTNGGVYCSQACRMADVDRSATNSEPVSPAFSDPQSSLPSSFVGYGSGFYLPPTIDFSIYKSSSKTTAPPRRTSTTATAKSTDPSSQQSQRSLTPSSSRTSLSSMHASTTQQNTLSDQIRQELQTYTSSFDRVRDLKRRMTAP